MNATDAGGQGELHRLLKRFDQAVLQFSPERVGKLDEAFRDLAAATEFSYFNRPSRHPTCVRLDGEQSAPRLWDRIHRAFSSLVRHQFEYRKQPDAYCGFPVLTYLRPKFALPDTDDRYSYMVVDAPLEKAGFAPDMELPRYNFDNDGALPLTACCLNVTGLCDFDTVPIVFHWHDPTAECPLCSLKPEGSGDGLAHVHIRCALPYRDKNAQEEGGLVKDYRAIADVEFRVIASEGGVDQQELMRRLRAVAGDRDVKEEVIIRRLAWTLAFFAYTCRHNIRIRGHDPAAARNLAVVFAPAKFTDECSAAILVPVDCKHFNPSTWPSLLNGLLFLARGVCLPLDQLSASLALARDELDRGRRIALQAFNHETKHVIRSLGDDRWFRTLEEYFDLSDTAQPVDSKKLGLLYSRTSDGLLFPWGRRHGNGDGDEKSGTMPADGDAARSHEDDEYRLVPFSNVYMAATRLVLAWTPDAGVSEMPFSWGSKSFPRTLEELIRACRAATFNVLLMHIFRNADLSPNNVAAIRSQIQVYERVLLSRDCRVVDDQEVFPRLDWESKQGEQKSRLLAQLMLHFSREDLHHADLLTPAQVFISSVARRPRCVRVRRVTIERTAESEHVQAARIRASAAALGLPEEVCLRYSKAFAQGQERGRDAEMSGRSYSYHGRETLRQLLISIDSEAQLLAPRSEQGRYIVEFEFVPYPPLIKEL